MRLRPPHPHDAPAVLAVLTARDLVDIGVPDVTLGDVEDQWSASDVDLGADARVVEADDDRLVAYGMVRSFGSFAVVAPDREARGIGTQLLRWVEARERDRGERPHRQWISAGNERAAALLTGAGYVRIRTYSRMARRLSLDAPGTDPARPPGYVLRTLDRDRDAVAVHAIDDAAFSAVPDYHPQRLEQFREQHLEAHDAAPDLSLVATAGGAPVAFLLTRRWAEATSGFIDILAVHPDHQHRGLGSALLRDAFGAFARAGLREAELGVASDNPRALRLYERVGMIVKFRDDVYERALGP